MLLDLLEAALRLLRLGRLRAEALHERALVGDDLLGAGDLRLLALARGRLLDDERGVVARVRRDGLVVDVEDVRGDVVEEALVVRDDERRAAVARRGTSRASGWTGCRGGWSARRGGATSGPPTSTCARRTRSLKPPESVDERLPVRRDGDAEPLEDGAWPAPRACSRRERAMRSSSSARRAGVALAVVDDARPLLRARATRRASPIIARSRMICASSRNRSCRRTPTRARPGIVTLPSVAGSSPARISRNVVLPEPLAPTRP